MTFMAFMLPMWVGGFGAVIFAPPGSFWLFRAIISGASAYFVGKYYATSSYIPPETEFRAGVALFAVLQLSLFTVAGSLAFSALVSEIVILIVLYVFFQRSNFTNPTAIVAAPPPPL
jgi:hypothetical protein